MGVSIGRHFPSGSKSAVLPTDFAPQFAGKLAVRVGISDAVKVRAAVLRQKLLQSTLTVSQPRL